MTTAYLLHAHHYDYLPYQVAALRRFMPDVERIVVVEGPFLDRLHDPTERLAEETREALRVEVLEVPSAPRGAVYSRILHLVNHCLAQPGGPRIVMHGDLVPTSPTSITELLGDSAAAGRADDRRQADLTWFAAVGPMALQTREPACAFRAYASRIINELHCEHCEPCFLHLDKAAVGYKIAEKLAMLREMFATLPPPLTVEAKSSQPAAPLSAEGLRREFICRGCENWDAQREGCGLLKRCDRRGLTVALWRRATGKCKLGKWVAAIEPGTSGHSIDVREVPTIVYTTATRTDQQNRIGRTLDGLGFTRWKFHFGAPHDGQGDFRLAVARDYSAILRAGESPLLLLEDDAQPRDWTPAIDVPAGAQIAMLGGGRGGSRRAIARAAKMFPGVRRGQGYGFLSIDDEWLRVFGMLYTHAYLWLDREAMREAADALAAHNRPADQTLAAEQWRWFVACRREPIFWQEGNGSSIDYAPLPYEKPAVRATRLRARRRAALAH